MLFCPQAPRQAQRSCKLPSNISSDDFYPPAQADSSASADLLFVNHDPPSGFAFFLS